MTDIPPTTHRQKVATKPAATPSSFIAKDGVFAPRANRFYSSPITNLRSSLQCFCRCSFVVLLLSILRQKAEDLLLSPPLRFPCAFVFALLCLSSRKDLLLLSLLLFPSERTPKKPIKQHVKPINPITPTKQTRSQLQLSSALFDTLNKEANQSQSYPLPITCLESIFCG